MPGDAQPPGDLPLVLLPHDLGSSGPHLPPGGWETTGGELVSRKTIYFSSATFIPVFNAVLGIG